MAATCRKCGDPVEGLGAVFVVYGEYDRNRQGFRRGDHHWHVCPECWRTEYDAKKATTYQPDSADELWAVLAASGGQLVADFSAFYIPGPAYARVVDDELQGATVTPVDVSDDPSTEYDLTFEAKAAEPHDLWLEELLEGEHDERPIWLVTADRTPFADLYDDVEPREWAAEAGDSG